MVLPNISNTLGKGARREVERSSSRRCRSKLGDALGAGLGPTLAVTRVPELGSALGEALSRGNELGARLGTFSVYTVSNSLGHAQGVQRSDPARDDDGAELGEPLRVERRPALAQMLEAALGNQHSAKCSQSATSMVLPWVLAHSPPLVSFGKEQSDPVHDDAGAELGDALGTGLGPALAQTAEPALEIALVEALADRQRAWCFTRNLLTLRCHQQLRNRTKRAAVRSSSRRCRSRTRQTTRRRAATSARTNTRSSTGKTALGEALSLGTELGASLGL